MQIQINYDTNLEANSNNASLRPILQPKERTQTTEDRQADTVRANVQYTYPC